jgi:hypothetical protein
MSMKRWDCRLCNKTLESLSYPRVDICEPCMYRAAREWGMVPIPAALFQQMQLMAQRVAPPLPPATSMGDPSVMRRVKLRPLR